ncbi:hypothetical protein [Curvivirga aplysinae]|uniref:hypothetical protein n=1 Tax=Curvivirga aplysinae TaxID=2529852 RepID=UPI0012BD19B1|nr:hypothetical protein [Curvivirga aplysinae]MTI08613.1 hypothetical protein [Curvivirga aplysinae]
MALISQILGKDLPIYTVGSGKEQINPESGLPAFADNWFETTNEPGNNPNNSFSQNAYLSTNSNELNENTNQSVSLNEMQPEQPDQSNNQLCFRLNVKLNEEKGELDLLERKVKNLCTNAAAKCKQYEAQESNEIAKAGFAAGAATFSTLGSMSSSAAIVGFSSAVKVLLAAIAVSQFWRAVDRYFDPLDQQVKELEAKIIQQKLNIKNAETNILNEGCKIEQVPPITFR